MTAGVPIRAGTAWRGAGPPPVDAAAVRARAQRIEPLGALALAVAGRLLAPAETIRRDVGVAVGTTLGCFETNAAFQRRLAAGGPGAASPRLFAATVSNAAAGEVGIAFGLGGPAVTVSAGVAAGLAAVEAARGEILAGGPRGFVVIGLDVVDEAGRRWLAEQGWPADAPGWEAAALGLGSEPAALPEVGRLEGIALGYAAPGRTAEGLRAVATAALRQAGRHVEEVAIHTPRPTAAAAIEAAFGAPVRSAADSPCLAAGALAALLRCLEQEPGAVLVVEACPSGHVAAAVAWSGAG